MTALTERESSRRFIVCAHRGDTSAGPDNSVAAVRSAAAKGCDRVEVDCRRSANGTWWLAHNSIASLSDAQLAANANNCTLQRAFDIAEQFGCALHLDVKESPTELAQWVVSKGYGGRCIFGGSSQSQMDAVKAVDPGLTCMGYEWWQTPQSQIPNVESCDDAAPVMIEVLCGPDASDAETMFARHARGIQVDDVDVALTVRNRLLLAAHDHPHTHDEAPADMTGSVLRDTCSQDDALTTTPKDVVGCSITFTPPTDETVVAFCTFDFDVFQAGATRAVGVLNVNGGDVPGEASFQTHPTSTGRATVPAGPFVVPVVAGVPVTFKLQAYKSANVGGVAVKATNTVLQLIRFG